MTRIPSEKSEEQAEELYNNLELIREENAMKENTYTISYKQKVNDEWILVTKTGRSDSEEAMEIMRDLTAGEIPEEHLEILIWTAEVNKNVGNLLEKMERRNYE